MEHNRKKPKNKVYLAIIGLPHGIKGDVLLKVLSAETQRLKTYGVLYDDMGRSYEIVTLRMQKKNAIVHFKGIEDRNVAESLKGVRLYVTRDQLLDDLGEDEFYQIDLIGLCVQDCVGKILGEVSGFFNFGAGDLLEIRLNTGKTVFIPFSKAAVLKICIPSGFLVVDPVAAGLSDEEKNAVEDGDLKQK
ncbi:ribosome maturation factor RimM [Bartonella vinsonii]|uniref:Ribosome maturation factor RimM n=1 Tax=Bartonella vinsonii subsp. berkhoffii str. Tweed TaxID=1094502 RepID=N6VPS7_BARVB|nr:ribosome maturation factor RimM [Bartonella vinsonii]AGF76504.1 16S rRNA processing protein RimM [Bartonella vinsonii subsp. berkhoffii str. Winnie]ENN93052.1 16S rRNA processing protein RimM [Bartonella vinsonii subsp. berkhoffii str. Tweed]